MPGADVDLLGLDADTKAELVARLLADEEWAVSRLHEGEARIAAQKPPSPRIGDPHAFPSGTVLDLPAGELSGQTVADGLATSGVLVVRGLLSADAVRRLREDIVMRDRLTPLVVAGTVDEFLGKAPALSPTHLICLPSTLRHLFEAYRESGFADVLEDFLGEPPVAVGPRARIVREERDIGLGWHQDAAFLGGRVQAVNAWTALTPVGVEAPSLELHPFRVDRIVGWEGRESELENTLAPLDYSADHDAEIAELTGGEKGFIPVLEPGDAVMFDAMTLHRTAKTGWQVDSRETSISWFVRSDQFPPYPPFAL